LALDHHASALIALLIQKWEHQEEDIGIHSDIVRIQPNALLTCCQLQIQKAPFFGVSIRGDFPELTGSSWHLVGL
jgi:hypothetical protein